jgi:hypothetical protein
MCVFIYFAQSVHENEAELEYLKLLTQTSEKSSIPYLKNHCYRIPKQSVLHRVKEERNILHTIRRRKANWIGHILRRKCRLKHIIEGKIRGTRRRGRRRKQLLDDLKEARRYWKLKEESQDRNLWSTQFVRGYGPIARQTTI